MGIVQSAAMALSVAGSIFFGAAVNNRDVEGLGDGWHRNVSVETPGSEQRSRFRPIFTAMTNFVSPPKNAGDPSLRVKTAAETINEPWRWGSSGNQS